MEYVVSCGRVEGHHFPVDVDPVICRNAADGLSAVISGVEDQLKLSPDEDNLQALIIMQGTLC